MSMGMSLVLAKPLTCINLHATNANSNTKSSLASSSSTFHPLKGFHYYGNSSSKTVQRWSAVTVRSSIQPVPPPTPPPNAAGDSASSGFPGRKGWIAGIVLSLILPFFKNKWGPLFFLKKNIDQKLQTVEDVVEALEKVADRVEHVAEDFGESLPEGSFKNAVQKIEDVAEKVELAAHLTDQAIDKAEASMNAQRIKKFVEENQRLADQCMKLEKECSLYDHDREALMEFGNEADERAKNAEIKVGELEEELKQRTEEVEYYKHQCQMLSVDPQTDDTITEQKSLHTLVASLVNKDEVAKTALDFLEANSEAETCRELLNMSNSLRPETQNIISLAAHVRTLQNDKEHLRINLHRAEEEVRVLFEENSVLDEENKRLLRLYKSEKKRASSGGKHDSSARAKSNKRKTSPVAVTSSPVDRKIEFDDVDNLRYPLCPLDKNSPGPKSHKKVSAVTAPATTSTTTATTTAILYS